MSAASTKATSDELAALKSAIDRAAREARQLVSDPPAAHRLLDEALRLSSLKRKLCGCARGESP